LEETLNSPESTGKSIKRPMPVVDADSAPYWEAAKEHRLLIQQCDACGTVRFPPVGICHNCRSFEYTWTPVTEVTLYSWVVIDRPVIESLQSQAPYIAALVDLGDDIHMPTNIMGIEPSRLEAGMALTVDFQDIEGGFSIPVFRPKD
jgi:uncharacterized OB-fold protein